MLKRQGMLQGPTSPEQHSADGRQEEPLAHKEHTSPRTQRQKGQNWFMWLYEHHYKKLLIIPIILLILSLAQIGYQIHTTGDFINKGIGLRGGVSITIPVAGLDTVPTESEILAALRTALPDNDVAVRSVDQTGMLVAFIIEADIDSSDNAKLDTIIASMDTLLGKQLKESDYSTELIGARLGASFFKQAGIAMLIAFALMALVVIIYFRKLIPSAAVILAGFSDIVMAIAVFNLLGMKLSPGGIAGFLMLIGYSVDTDILLSTRVLRSKEGTVMDHVYSAIKTGLTMQFAALAALTVAVFVSPSEVIDQIMIILIIGLVADIINTWIQNVGILRLYMEKRKQR